MNVLFVIHYPVFGGPHNQALLLTRALAKQNVAMTVVIPDSPGNACERLRAGGVDVVTIPLRRLRDSLNPLGQAAYLARLPLESAAIGRIIRERKIDLVQVGGLANPHGAFAGRLAKVPIVWQILDTRPPMTFRRLMMPLVVRLADVVMSTGRAVASAHPGADDLGDRLRVFFPPVDSEFFQPEAVDRDAARRGFGFGDGDVVVGTVGNLNPQKGHEHLLRGAALARGAERNLKVLVVGASHDTHLSYERELRRLASRLGLSVGRDVVFAGGLGDVRPALAAMDLFVLSSVPRSEGAPTAIEEAMMMGLPVVATDVGAVRELVDDGHTGFVVPPRDPRRLADAVLSVLREPQLREEFGSRARERAAARFSTEKCAQVHMEAYELALRRARDGSR